MKFFYHLRSKKFILKLKKRDHDTSSVFALCAWVSLAVAIGYCRQSSAQTTVPSQSTDCTSSLLTDCTQTQNPPQTNLPQTNFPIDSNQNGLNGLRGNQGTQNSGNSTYVDSADRLSGQQTKRQTPEEFFPPDPVTDLQRLAKSSTGELLPIFGRDFFKQVPSTFAPGDEMSVAPDYVVGPGDDVLLRFWGPESFNSQLTVDRSGAIYVPKVGSIHVAGLHFEELQQQITTALSRTYRHFDVSVNLGRLRSIQIYVVGEARRPGAYTISALSTVLNALFTSGGPNVQGSLRHIQVRRAGQTLPEFDLYDLVLRGDKSKDVRLEQGDTIFIPPVGAQAALAGSVRHPAIYELTADDTLGDLLKIAGGFSSTASSTQLSLERIEPDHARRAITVALDTAGSATSLRDGDVILAGHITAGYQQSVTIRGNLANPGRFAWHPGMRLIDIIPDRSSLLTRDYWRERNRLGLPVPLFEPLPNPNRFGNSYMNRTGEDQTNSSETGNYPGLDENGLPRDQNQSNSDSQNNQNDPNNQNNQTNQNYQGIGSKKDQASALAQVGLASGGIVNQEAQAGRSNERRPPEYGTDPQAKPLTQIKIRIPAPEIDWSYAVIERLDPNSLKSSLVPFNLGKLVQDHDPNQNLPLQPGDVITIISQNDVPVPQQERTKYVRLEGEFPGAGVYSVLPDETLDQLVRRAGGLTGKAYLYGSSFTRESARVYQQQRLDEYISTLSTDLERSAAVRAASSATGILDPNALAEQRSLVAQLRQLRATGRVVLEFIPTSAGDGSIPAIPLENDDVFRVPTRPNTVSVIGAVYGQNIFLYNADRKLGDYISLAGKPNRIADPKHAFIIRADGSIFSRERAEGVWSNSFDSAHINPGDTIVIPEQLIKPTVLRQLLDYSQILSAFGLAAAAINVVR